MWECGNASACHRLALAKGDERNLTERRIKLNRAQHLFIAQFRMAIAIFALSPIHKPSCERELLLFYRWRTVHNFYAISHLVKFIAAVVLDFCNWTGFSVFYERRFSLSSPIPTLFSYVYVDFSGVRNKYACGNALLHTDVHVHSTTSPE